MIKNLKNVNSLILPRTNQLKERLYYQEFRKTQLYLSLENLSPRYQWPMQGSMSGLIPEYKKNRNRGEDMDIMLAGTFTLNVTLILSNI